MSVRKRTSSGSTKDAPPAPPPCHKPLSLLVQIMFPRRVMRCPYENHPAHRTPWMPQSFSSSSSSPSPSSQEGSRSAPEIPISEAFCSASQMEVSEASCCKLSFWLGIKVLPSVQICWDFNHWLENWGFTPLISRGLLGQKPDSCFATTEELNQLTFPWGWSFWFYASFS